MRGLYHQSDDYQHNYLMYSRARNTRLTKSLSATFVDTGVSIRSGLLVAEYLPNRESMVGA